jgi:hypothetical protein
MHLAASHSEADPTTRTELTYVTKSAEQTPVSGFTPNCD